MKFNKLITDILKEEISKEDRMTALKSLANPQPVFKFNYVSWDWKEPQPTKELEMFDDREMFPFVYESSLGSDGYFVFFSDIRLSERDCITLSLVPCYDMELKEDNMVEFVKTMNAYVSYVSLEELKEALHNYDI